VIAGPAGTFSMIKTDRRSIISSAIISSQNDRYSFSPSDRESDHHHALCSIAPIRSWVSTIRCWIGSSLGRFQLASVPSDHLTAPIETKRLRVLNRFTGRVRPSFDDCGPCVQQYGERKGNRQNERNYSNVSTVGSISSPMRNSMGRGSEFEGDGGAPFLRRASV
jgi:hypothetical protein